MNILVTGGAGYKGSLLIPRLLEKGYNVTLFDNFKWSIKPIIHFATHPNLQIIEGDVRDEALIKKSLEGQDLVIHLAAIVGYPACAADRNLAIETNVDGTRNVVNNIGKRKLIFASTGSTYGKVEGICTEETPIDPLTLYGSTKWEAEQMVTNAGGVALRFATVFGVSPRMRLDLLINDFVYQAVNLRQVIIFEGHFRRTFLHVADAVESYLLAIDKYSEMSGQAFNIGDNKMNFTKLEVANTIKKHIDYYLHEAQIGKDLDQRDYEVSYDKVKALGFESKISLDDGVLELEKLLKHIHIDNDGWRNI